MEELYCRLRLEKCWTDAVRQWSNVIHATQDKMMPCNAMWRLSCYVMPCHARQDDAMQCHVALAMHCKVKAFDEYHTRQGDVIVSYVTQCDAMWPNMKQCDANHARQGDSMWCNKTLYEALDALSHCVIHWNTVWRKKLNAMWFRRQNVTLII